MGVKSPAITPSVKYPTDQRCPYLVNEAIPKVILTVPRNPNGLFLPRLRGSDHLTPLRSAVIFKNF